MSKFKNKLAGFFYGRYGKKRAVIEMKKRAEYKPRFNGKEN